LFNAASKSEGFMITVFHYQNFDCRFAFEQNVQADQRIFYPDFKFAGLMFARACGIRYENSTVTGPSRGKLNSDVYAFESL